MPKISKEGGPSIGSGPPEGVYLAPGVAEAEREALREESQWPRPEDGGNLSTSSESSDNTPETSSSEFPSPAPTTVNPSSKDLTTPTFVESTGGPTPEIGSDRAIEPQIIDVHLPHN